MNLYLVPRTGKFEEPKPVLLADYSTSSVLYQELSDVIDFPSAYEYSDGDIVNAEKYAEIMPEDIQEAIREINSRIRDTERFIKSYKETFSSLSDAESAFEAANELKHQYEYIEEQNKAVSYLEFLGELLENIKYESYTAFEKLVANVG